MDPSKVNQFLPRFRSRWIAALQLLYTLFWTLHPLPTLHTDEPPENWISWSGYWYVMASSSGSKVNIPTGTLSMTSTETTSPIGPILIPLIPTTIPPGP
jgi:hypothetical protein